MDGPLVTALILKIVDNLCMLRLHRIIYICNWYGNSELPKLNNLHKILNQILLELSFLIHQ